MAVSSVGRNGLHLLTAFAVVAAIAWFVKTVWDSPAAWERLRVPAILLAILVVIQLMLGIEAWLARFGAGELPDLQQTTMGQAAIRTAHVLLGSWLLAISVSCILLARGSTVPRAAVELERPVFETRRRTDALLNEPQTTTGVQRVEGAV